jgi:hypothetical protein
VRGATDERSGLLSRWLQVRILPHPPFTRPSSSGRMRGSHPRDAGSSPAGRSSSWAGMAEWPRHRPSKPETRVRVPLPAPSQGSRSVAGRRSLKPVTRVRVPPPLPRSQGRGVTGNTLGSGPRDCGFEACRPFHLAGIARGAELPPCKRVAWVRFPASASHSGVAQRQCRRLLTVPMQVRILPPEPLTRVVSMRGHAAGCNPAEPSSTLGRLSSRHGPVVQRPGPRILNPATRVRFPPGSPPRRVRPVAQDAGPSSRKRGFESRTRPAFSSACSSDREERRFGGPKAAGSSPATLTILPGCSSVWLRARGPGP